MADFFGYCRHYKPTQLCPAKYFEIIYWQSQLRATYINVTKVINVWSGNDLSNSLQSYSYIEEHIACQLAFAAASCQRQEKCTRLITS